MRQSSLLSEHLNQRHLTSVVSALRSQEAQFLWIAAATGPAIVLAAVLVWTSAWSPVALERPAALFASGQHEAAVLAYDRLAAGPGPSAVRSEAAWRAAQLSAVQTADPGVAIARLEGLLASSPGPPALRRAEAHALVAGLELRGRMARRAAATHWEHAARLAPDHPDAGRWLLESGKAYALAGESGPAQRVLMNPRVLTENPGAAWLALARLHLSVDPATAYDAYDRAHRATAAGTAQHALARLGRATALERLEGREAALAELDEAWAQGEVLDQGLIRRRQRLQAGL